MSQQNEWQRGVFRTYRATEKIHLGKYETNIVQNDPFDYDGYTVRYAGMEYSVPQLRGMLGMWLVSISDTTTTYVPQPGGVEVRAATPEGAERGEAFTMGEASEEEAVVGTLGETREVREAARDGNLTRLQELRQQRRAQAEQRLAAQQQAFVNSNSNPKALPPVNSGDVVADLEDALMEQTTQTYTRAQPVNSTGAGTGQAQSTMTESAALAHANAVNARAIQAAQNQPFQKVSREQMGGQRFNKPKDGKQVRAGSFQGRVISADQSDGAVVGSYKFSGGASVGSEGQTSRESVGTDVSRMRSNQPVQVGRAVAAPPRQNRRSGAIIREDPTVTHQPQAVRAAQTTQVSSEGNVSIAYVGPDGATGDVSEARTGDDLASLLPNAALANAPYVPPVRPLAPVAEPERTEEEEIAFLLSDWNKKRHWKSRVKEALDYYADWPEALDAIYAVEAASVVKHIKEGLAK